MSHWKKHQPFGVWSSNIHLEVMFEKQRFIISSNLHLQPLGWNIFSCPRPWTKSIASINQQIPPQSIAPPWSIPPGHPVQPSPWGLLGHPPSGIPLGASRLAWGIPLGASCLGHPAPTWAILPSISWGILFGTSWGQLWGTTRTTTGPASKTSRTTAWSPKPRHPRPRTWPQLSRWPRRLWPLRAPEEHAPWPWQWSCGSSCWTVFFLSFKESLEDILLMRSFSDFNRWFEEMLLFILESGSEWPYQRCHAEWRKLFAHSRRAVALKFEVRAMLLPIHRGSTPVSQKPCTSWKFMKVQHFPPQGCFCMNTSTGGLSHVGLPRGTVYP